MDNQNFENENNNLGSSYSAVPRMETPNNNENSVGSQSQFINQDFLDKQQAQVMQNKIYDQSNSNDNSNNMGISDAAQSVNTEELLKDEGLKRVTFDYVVTNSYGQKIKSSFDALSESEVRAFLINEGYKIVSITPRKKINMDINLFGSKMKTSDLTFALTQLATYIKAGISLIDSVRILAKQTSDPKKRKIYDRIVYDLVTGENFSTALERQSNVFPKLLINMVKTAEMTGDLPSVLDEMSEYYKEIEETRKQVISSLTYPAIIFVFAIVVVAFCLIWVVPSFTTMYASTDDLPGITKFTLSMSNFLSNNYIIIVVVLALLLIGYKYAFDNIKPFRKAVQSFYMRLPVIGNIIIYGEVNTFTKTFASLINHNVNIEQSMEVLQKITNNEIYKDIIDNTIKTLQSGGKISESFRGNKAFPVVAYEMLVTGESTGQLGLMMEKVADHYNNMHRTAMTSLKSLIEPVTILFLAVMVGYILLSMFIPMFDIYNQVLFIWKIFI